MWDRVLFWFLGGLFLAQTGFIAVNISDAPNSLDLALDGNVPAIVHSLVLLSIAVTAAALWATGTWQRQESSIVAPMPNLWLGTALGFLYFAMDEAFMIHERVAPAAFRAIGLWDRIVAGEVTYAAWEALYAPLFGGICLMVLVLLFRSRRSYQVSFWLGLVAIGIWGAALLLEFVGFTFSLEDHQRRETLSRMEEASELLGSTLFLTAVALMFRGALSLLPTRARGDESP